MTTIDISKHGAGYIDLAGTDQEIKLIGEHKGDRIVLRGAVNKAIYTEGVVIESTRKEPDKDALVFTGRVINTNLIADGLQLVYGGLTFWDSIDNSSFENIEIFYPNAGIKASKDLTHSNVAITKCTIIGAQREGIYFGPHYEQEKKSKSITLAYNDIKFCGWDAIQVNAQHALVYGNIIDNPAKLREPNQDYGITIQPGSVAYVWDNRFINTPKRIQALDSRYFDHKPGLLAQDQ